LIVTTDLIDIRPRSAARAVSADPNQRDSPQTGQTWPSEALD